MIFLTHHNHLLVLLQQNQEYILKIKYKDNENNKINWIKINQNYNNISNIKTWKYMRVIKLQEYKIKMKVNNNLKKEFNNTIRNILN